MIREIKNLATFIPSLSGVFLTYFIEGLSGLFFFLVVLWLLPTIQSNEFVVAYSSMQLLLVFSIHGFSHVALGKKQFVRNDFCFFIIFQCGMFLLSCSSLFLLIFIEAFPFTSLSVGFYLVAFPFIHLNIWNLLAYLSGYHGLLMIIGTLKLVVSITSVIYQYQNGLLSSENLFLTYVSITGLLNIIGFVFVGVGLCKTSSNMQSSGNLGRLRELKFAVKSSISSSLVDVAFNFDKIIFGTFFGNLDLAYLSLVQRFSSQFQGFNRIVIQRSVFRTEAFNGRQLKFLCGVAYVLCVSSLSTVTFFIEKQSNESLILVLVASMIVFLPLLIVGAQEQGLNSWRTTFFNLYPSLTLLIKILLFCSLVAFSEPTVLALAVVHVIAEFSAVLIARHSAQKHILH